MKQEAQLSQRDCRMLRVIEYVARSFKVIRIEMKLLRTIRAEHEFKFCAVGSSTQAFRHSFAVRIVGDRNSLPSHVVEQSTPASFKAELSRLAPAHTHRKVLPPIHAILHEEDCELFIRIRSP